MKNIVIFFILCFAIISSVYAQQFEQGLFIGPLTGWGEIVSQDANTKIVHEEISSTQHKVYFNDAETNKLIYTTHQSNHRRNS